MKVFAILLMIKTVFSAPINPGGNQQYLILNHFNVQLVQIIFFQLVSDHFNVQLGQMVITVGHLFKTVWYEMMMIYLRS